jgi:prepilin-type N-terminal cleavage/methylation domain-containing protein
MRRAGFTLIELMAVVALLGLLAGAVAWSLADTVERATRGELRARLMEADRRARQAARRRGAPHRLRLDLAAQHVQRRRGGEADALARAIPAPWTLTRVRVAPGTEAPGYRAARAAPRPGRGGQAEIGISAGGRSPSNALRLAKREA